MTKGVKSTSDTFKSKRATKVSEQYSVRTGDCIIDRQEILRLWSYLEGAPGNEKLDWFYLDNPAGTGIVYFLYYEADNRPVGVICIGRRDFQIGCKTYRGGVFGDFSIEPSHRSLGPALYFQKEFLAYALESLDIVYGFPNHLSGKVRTYGSHKLEGTLGVYVLPIGIHHYFAHYIPRWVARTVGRAFAVLIRMLIYFPLRKRIGTYAESTVNQGFAEQLWKITCIEDIKSGIRGWPFLNWRLAQNLSGPLEFLGVVDRNGTPAGYIAHCEKDDRSIEIVDYHTNDTNALAALLSLLINEKVLSGAKSISICSSDTDASRLACLRKLRFSVRRRHKYFIALGSSAQSHFDKLDVQMTLADNDI